MSNPLQYKFSHVRLAGVDAARQGGRGEGSARAQRSPVAGPLGVRLCPRTVLQGGENDFFITLQRVLTFIRAGIMF